MDLSNCDGIEEAFDNAEYTGETPRGVDQVHFAESLRIVVLRDGRGLLDVTVYGANFRQANSFEIEDRAGRFKELIRLP